MKIFILSYESTRKTRKNTVDHFLISFLVPEVSASKEVQNGTRTSSPIVEFWQNFAENGEICDVTRFTCQLANYEISYDLSISCNNRMKLSRQKVP